VLQYFRGINGLVVVLVREHHPRVAEVVARHILVLPAAVLGGREPPVIVVHRFQGVVAELRIADVFLSQEDVVLLVQLIL
jgi:hypothetical protein